MLTIRLFSVITISVLMVWRFFLPEYQLCCFRLGRWIGWSVQSVIRASVQNQKDKEVILNSAYTPRTTGAVL
jgi:hypothetical protein